MGNCEKEDRQGEPEKQEMNGHKFNLQEEIEK